MIGFKVWFSHMRKIRVKVISASIEIIREFQKGAGHDEARAPVHARTAMSEKDRQSCRPFRLRAAADWV
jgi:hypothetical protein